MNKDFRPIRKNSALDKPNFYSERVQLAQAACLKFNTSQS
jgi:hypothetical protein